VYFDILKNGSKGRPKVEEVFETFWRKTWGRVCSRCTYKWFLRLLKNLKTSRKNYWKFLWKIRKI